MSGLQRRALKTALINALSGYTSGRVSYGAARPDWGLPNIVINIEEDRYSFSKAHMNNGIRDLRVSVEIRDTMNDDEWNLDTSCYHVEKIISSASTIAATVTDLHLVATEYQQDDADQDYGVAIIFYEGFQEE